MELVSSTHDRLVLRARPLWFGIGIACALLLFAAIFLNKLSTGDEKELLPLGLLFGIFAIVFAVFVRQEVAIFDRATQTLTLRNLSVFGLRTQSHDLADARRAVTEEKSDGDDSRGRAKRPVLNFGSGPPVPISDIYRGGPSADEAVKHVNAWLGLGQRKAKPAKGRAQ